MPRIGMNPARNQLSGYKPARITLAMLTHVPNLGGYFEHRFDVLQLSLESLILNTPQPNDLMVFDNASCPEVVDYLRQLRDQGHIQFLILSSENIGKIGALQILFRSAPGEIVAYTDDDIFFLPGWLDEHMKIMEAFPQVGMATGFYIRSHMSYGIQSTLKFARQDGVAIKTGSLIPKEMEDHYVENMGRTWESYTEEIQGCEDMLLTYHGVEALVSAGHHQFVAPRQVILDVLPKQWGGQLMGRMLELDNAVDQLGYLRLSTRPFVTRLLGNMISAENAKLANGLGLSATGKLRPRNSSTGLGRIYRIPMIRRLMQGFYNRLHKALYT